jgi:hypothetical protein
VKKLGEKPWDVILSLKATIDAQEGQDMLISFKGKGEELKFVFGPVEQKRVARKVLFDKKVQKVKVQFPHDGKWPLKIQFPKVGIYEIGPMQLDIQ